MQTFLIIKKNIKLIFLSLLIFLIEKIDHYNSILFFNIIFFLKKKPLRFGYNNQNKLFFLKDGYIKHYFSNKTRGINLYSSGLSFRANQIADSYKLKNINFKFSDLVIDCGANYGDLWLYLRDKINKKNYITFEPGINEYRALKKNVQSNFNYNLGLGKVESKTNFYINEKDADSSIIEPIIYDRIHEIQTTTLNNFFIKYNIKSIKLLKLEAEGYEPEILLGSNKILNKIEYIAIDGGYERGKDLEETLSKQLNFLLENDFEIIEINLKWGRALLKSKLFNKASLLKKKK
ncbi:SAM-dependent methyltransferase [Prochlorococcus marinus str. MIT 9202]|nr:SAM-dependent methyltransferase [Prochlorococcus marinus str. MIT 9202]